MAQSPFFGGGAPSRCSARCIPTALAIAREGLGLDPDERKEPGAIRPEAIFAALEREINDPGSAITRISVADVVEKIGEGAAAPIVLVHSTGHLYVLFGAIRVNDKLMCQVVHGGEAVSLLTKELLLAGGFLEAWRLENRDGLSVPIHVGSSTIGIDKLWHNFGEVLPEQSLECAFRLKNTSDQTVVIGRPVVSCQCTVPNLGDRLALAPGQTFDLKVTTKATGATSLRNSVGLEFYEQRTGASRRVALAFIGSQRATMEVVPQALDLGTVSPGHTSFRTVCLIEKPTDRFVITNVTGGRLAVLPRIEIAKGHDGLATYRIHLDLSIPNDPPGTHRDELAVATDSHGRSTVKIPVVFRIDPPVRAVPSVISLGTVRPGEVRQENVQFVSRDGGRLHIQVLSHPDECTITVPSQTEDLARMLVSVQLKRKGIWQGTITLKTRSANGSEMIELSCVAYVQE